MQNKPIVLLIDDDSDDQEIFSIALEKADGNVECVFANDGIQALEILRHDPDFVPDYVFIDMNMPRMNGQQCLAEIKKIDRLKSVPVYMYSTSVSPESLETNKQLGAKDFIVKPSSINELISILKNILRKPVLAIALFVFLFSSVHQDVYAQDQIRETTELKKLSVEELMNIVVTSVSKTPENLSEVASAIQVVTGYDIRRSPAMRLPEAMRLAPNLQVMQSGSHDWGISARGFNGAPTVSSSLADKLLVMIDGRTVYTPLFGGVFWDVQNVLLEDVDRIEVVSGPGGTLWGSNAVNGVVNIMTKTAKETQGLYMSGTYGSLLRDHLALRYGGQVDSALFFRIYGQRFDYDNTLLADGSDARDEWNLTSGGFRMDYVPRGIHTMSLQGELYAGSEDDTLPTIINGQHLLAKWTTTYSEVSGMTVQAYFDRTWRDIRNNPFTDELTTFDIDMQQRFPLGPSNNILMGIAYRLQKDKTSSFDNRFDPADQTLTLYSGFIQDQIDLIPERFTVTVGSKFLHNIYTGFEIQPSFRLAWTPHASHTVWGAVSRAVRTPSRFDVELSAFNGGPHPEFISEKVISYELGYRLRPLRKVSLSVATFYNQYDDLRSISTTDNPALPFYFGNDLESNTWGFELSGHVLISDWWRLRGGCSFLGKEFTYTSDNVFQGTELFEAIDPKNHFLLQSVMDISKSFQLDVVVRYLDKLPAIEFSNLPEVKAYTNLNVRLAYEYKFLTLSLSGQNLLDEARTEFGRRQIPRSIYGNITLRI